MEGVEAAISACGADGRNQVLGQELSEEAEEVAYKDMVREAQEKGPDAKEPFGGPRPLKAGGSGKSVADARWVLTWKTVEGVTTAQARLVGKGLQDPDLKGRVVGPGMRGHVGMCEPSLAQSSGYLSQLARKIGTLEPGHQEYLSQGGRLQSGCLFAHSSWSGTL